MVIHIEICDCCHKRTRGVDLTRFCVDGGQSFDVCDWCQKGPFRRLPPSPRAVALLSVIDMALEAP